MHSERKQRKRRRLNQKSEPILLTLANRLSKSFYDKNELGSFTFHRKINESEVVLLWQRLCIMTVLPDTKAVKEPQNTWPERVRLCVFKGVSTHFHAAASLMLQWVSGEPVVLKEGLGKALTL